MTSYFQKERIPDQGDPTVHPKKGPRGPEHRPICASMLYKVFTKIIPHQSGCDEPSLKNKRIPPRVQLEPHQTMSRVRGRRDTAPSTSSQKALQQNTNVSAVDQVWTRRMEDIPKRCTTISHRPHQPMKETQGDTYRRSVPRIKKKSHPKKDNV
ncbi:hypothetical protein RB195_020357 [Necator americanus]|uniref:Uncharacterized protein n=1 Tax=Necator americanus TaxID=51031 RepID=A0ABR1CKT8_NECAM